MEAWWFAGRGRRNEGVATATGRSVTSRLDGAGLLMEDVLSTSNRARGAGPTSGSLLLLNTRRRLRRAKEARPNVPLVTLSHA